MRHRLFVCIHSVVDRFQGLQNCTVHGKTVTYCTSAKTGGLDPKRVYNMEKKKEKNMFLPHKIQLIMFQVLMCLLFSSEFCIVYFFGSIK